MLKLLFTVLLVVVILLIGSLIAYIFNKRSQHREQTHSSTELTVKKPVEKARSQRKWITKSYFSRKGHQSAYKPGKLALSMVSAAILEDYGAIFSRKIRREFARNDGSRFIAYYND